MSVEQFIIGENRARPPYQVKTARCPSCEAPLSMYSEKSQLVVCDYCNEKLDCSQEELKALGKDNADNPGYFRFNLHQECTWQKVKYKVIARIRSTDKWAAEITDYLLFHPFQGTMWISIYDGEDELEFSVSKPNKARSKQDPFSMSKGDCLTTEDGERWRWEESNEIRITYVDGALPWLAKVGDTHTEIELIGTVNQNFSLCVERSSIAGGSELEYSVFKTVSSGAIFQAFGVEEEAPKRSSYESKPSVPGALRWTMFVISGVAGLYFLVSCFMTDKVLVDTFHFSATEVEMEMLSPTFTIAQEDIHQAVEIEYIASVDNSWLSLNVGIVSSPRESDSEQTYPGLLIEEKNLPAEEQTTLRHLSDVDISYYHGYEGGESWSEGSRTESQLLMFPEGGNYRLFLSGVSGYGETAEQVNLVSLTVNVYKNANVVRYYFMMCVFTILILIAFKDTE